MSLQIFILGVLCSGNHHPYDIKKMFKQNNMDEISKINDGTLYYNFEVLLKKGHIEKIEVIRDDNRPEKTTYGITEQGREALKQEIYNSFKNSTNVESLYSSILFLKYTDRQKISFLIEESIERLSSKISNENQLWDTIQSETPPSVHLIHEHAQGKMRLELEWLQKLAQWVREQK